MHTKILWEEHTHLPHLKQLEDYDPEDYHLKRRNRRIYNPTPERFTHGTFAESSADKAFIKIFYYK
jgi:hypothetical protein